MLSLILLTSTIWQNIVRFVETKFVQINNNINNETVGFHFVAFFQTITTLDIFILGVK